MEVEDIFYFDKYYENDLPERIYETIQDFYNKIPSSTEKVVGREEGKKYYENPKDLMAFKYAKNDDILKNPFTVVYRGNLYFGIKPSNKHESTKMKGNFGITYSKNYYIKVKYATPQYFYAEMSGGPVGQAIATMGAANYYGASYNLKNNLYPFILVNNE